MSSEGLEPITPASEHPQNHAWDREATGIGMCLEALIFK